jgi:hypothetical protein
VVLTSVLQGRAEVQLENEGELRMFLQINMNRRTFSSSSPTLHHQQSSRFKTSICTCRRWTVVLPQKMHINLHKEANR